MSTLAPLRRVRVSREVVSTLLAAYDDPRRTERAGEPCGLLLGLDPEPGRFEVEAAPATSNRHDRPTRAFAFGLDEVHDFTSRARENGRAVLGCWCAHLDGPPQPRRADLDTTRRLRSSRSPAAPPLLLIVGRGAGRRPVIRAFAVGPRAVREIGVVV